MRQRLKRKTNSHHFHLKHCCPFPHVEFIVEFNFFSTIPKTSCSFQTKMQNAALHQKRCLLLKKHAKRCCKTSCTSRRKRPYAEPVQIHLRPHHMQQMKFADNKDASKHARQLVDTLHFTCKVQNIPKTHHSQMSLHHSASYPEFCTKNVSPIPKEGH